MMHVWNSVKQKRFWAMFNDLRLAKLFKDHVLLPSNKGKKVCMVAKSWCVKKCKSFLDMLMYVKIAEIGDVNQTLGVIDPFYQ